MWPKFNVVHRHIRKYHTRKLHLWNTRIENMSTLTNWTGIHVRHQHPCTLSMLRHSANIIARCNNDIEPLRRRQGVEDSAMDILMTQHADGCAPRIRCSMSSSPEESLTVKMGILMGLQGRMMYWLSEWWRKERNTRHTSVSLVLPTILAVGGPC